jgi:predicted nucleotidyltransferase
MAKKKRKSHTKKKKSNVKEIKEQHLEKSSINTEKDIAMDFAEKVHKKFDRMVKATVLFGSQATNEAKSESDIDIILIIDDASLNWDLELISWYREELGKLIAAQQYSRDLHINTIKLTTWWQDLLHGDPVVINILRYGQPLIDSGGFFKPLKSLLIQGRIRSTPEAVYMALQRAPSHLGRSKLAILSSLEGVYWTMIDAAQAALITAGKLPPSPEHIPQLLKESFVDNKLMKIDRVRQLKEIYLIHKAITHREINEIKGNEIDKWQEIAEDFLLDMTKIIDRMIDSQRSEKK